MAAADSLVESMKELINISMANKDTTVLCQIASQVDAYHYDIYAIPDITTVIRNVPNMTIFDFQVGDYCYIYKVNGSYSNTFICCKKGSVSVADCTNIISMIDTAISNRLEEENLSKKTIRDLREEVAQLRPHSLIAVAPTAGSVPYIHGVNMLGQKSIIENSYLIFDDTLVDPATGKYKSGGYGNVYTLDRNASVSVTVT